MTTEGVFDDSRGNVPNLVRIVWSATKAGRFLSDKWDAATYPDLFIFRPSSEISTIWTKANASNVQISFLVDRVVLKM